MGALSNIAHGLSLGHCGWRPFPVSPAEGGEALLFLLLASDGVTTGGQRGAARHPLSSQGAVLPGGSTGASAHAEEVAVRAAGQESRGKGTWFGAGVAVSDPGWEGCAPSGGQSRHRPPEHTGRPSQSQETGPNHTPAGGRSQPETVRAQPALGTSSGWLSQALGVCVGGGEGAGVSAARA